MYLSIDAAGALSLEEADDFKRFHITADPPALAGDGAPAAFRAIAQDAGEGHFWLSADAIVEMSGRADDDGWTTAFWSMLEKAEPYGFSDVSKRLIKAHVA